MILQGQSVIMDNRIEYDHTVKFTELPSLLDDITDIGNQDSQFEKNEVSEMWKVDGRASFRIHK